MNKHTKISRKGWLLPLLLALPVLAGAAAVMMIWGEKIRDIFSILIKLVVIA